MATSGGVFERLRRPEYTGENRCTQCTIVNTVFAVGLSVLVAAGLATRATLGVSVGVGLAVFVGCAGAIYFRGYLVPGTPMLTKRYFPDWVLAAFGKAPETPGRGFEGDFDPDAALRGVGALEECQGGDDLCLTDQFEAEWDDQFDRLDDDASRYELLSLLQADDGEVTYQEFGEAFRASVDGDLVGQWESEAAFLADLGAARLLSERHPDWETLTLENKSRLLGGLRLFIHVCPTCGGTPEFETETVESCCSTHDVAAVSCLDCGARLFESKPI